MARESGFTRQQALLAALRRLTMAELRALGAVKAAGTLSGAAATLGVSQPTLSQHVREIEHKLGLVLFDRHRRGIEPTPVGAVMLRLAGAVQSDLAWAAEELALAASTDEPLRVGSMALTSGGLLAVALGRFAQDASSPMAILHEGPRETLLELLRKGRIDLFVGRLPEEAETADLRRETLFMDSAVVIAAARHPLARRARVGLDQLAPYGWALPADDTAFRQQIDTTFRQRALQMPRARVASYSMLAIPAVVSISSLVGFLPTSLYASGTVSSSLQRLDVPIDWVPSSVGILMNRDVANADRLAAFLGVLRAVAASARAAMLAR